MLWFDAIELNWTFLTELWFDFLMLLLFYFFPFLICFRSKGKMFIKSFIGLFDMFWFIFLFLIYLFHCLIKLTHMHVLLCTKISLRCCSTVVACNSMFKTLHHCIIMFLDKFSSLGKQIVFINFLKILHNIGCLFNTFFLTHFTAFFIYYSYLIFIYFKIFLIIYSPTCKRLKRLSDFWWWIFVYFFLLIQRIQRFKINDISNMFGLLFFLLIFLD